VKYSLYAKRRSTSRGSGAPASKISSIWNIYIKNLPIILVFTIIILFLTWKIKRIIIILWMKSSIWSPEINESELIMDNACQEIHNNFLLTQTSVSYQKNIVQI
jgi:hypothetical protein